MQKIWFSRSKKFPFRVRNEMVISGFPGMKTVLLGNERKLSFPFFPSTKTILLAGQEIFLDNFPLYFRSVTTGPLHFPSWVRNFPCKLSAIFSRGFLSSLLHLYISIFLEVYVQQFHAPICSDRARIILGCV